MHDGRRADAARPELRRDRSPRPGRAPRRALPCPLRPARARWRRAAPRRARRPSRPPAIDLVVAADGARSALRRDAVVRPYPWGALWFIGERGGLAPDVLDQVVDGTRFLAGVLPTGRAQASLFFSVRADRPRECLARGLGAWRVRARAPPGRRRARRPDHRPGAAAGGPLPRCRDEALPPRQRRLPRRRRTRDEPAARPGRQPRAARRRRARRRAQGRRGPRRLHAPPPRARPLLRVRQPLDDAVLPVRPRPPRRAARRADGPGRARAVDRPPDGAHDGRAHGPKAAGTASLGAHHPGARCPTGS